MTSTDVERPNLLFSGSPVDARLRDALAGAEAIASFGVDVPATLSWVSRVGGSDRPRDAASEWELLAATAVQDVGAARALEPHLDAGNILDEAHAAGIRVDLEAVGAGEDALWGVYAAEGPGARLEARPGTDGWSLTGTKPWCSLASHVTHALITAWVSPDERRLFAVDLRQPAVSVRPGPWHARGLRQIVSAPVDFDRARAIPVGEAGWYLRRDGFARGGVGVAACWWGGAFALRTALADAAASTRADQLAAMHLGRADAALWAARSVLRDAAAAFDCGDAPHPSLLASRTRAVVADAAETVLATAAHALGPAPLATDEAHARRVADLELYIRQHHAERDIARLGAQLIRTDSAW
jgi:hypothetical protein